MRRRYVQLLARKLICLVMSVTMVTGSLAGAAFAAETEAAEAPVSEVELSCVTKPLELSDNGRSIQAKLCLTQEDSLIQQKIFKENIVLGGVFRNMVVHDVENDHKTILLDLIGVPDFSDEDDSTQGTMEFSGFLFDCDGSVTAGIDVIERKEGQKRRRLPSTHFWMESVQTETKWR